MLEMVRTSGARDVSVPPTIQALLAARIDQLPPAERAAQSKGRYSTGAVQALAPEEPQLERHLRGLVRKELVRPSPPMLPGDDAFRFRHLLIRDAAYDALPKAARADLHESFAVWIAEHGADLVELDELVGYHLEQAAQYRAELGTPDAPLAERAPRPASEPRACVLSSGSTSMRPRTSSSARFDLLCPADPRHVPLLATLGETVYGTGDLERCERLLALTVERAKLIGDETTAGRTTLFGAFVRGHRGSHSLSSLLDEMNAAVEVLERSGDDEMLARALISRGWIWHWLGKAAIATAHGSRAMELAAVASTRAIEAEAAGLVVAEMRWGPTPWTELAR
jgi:hypothetical protein